MSLHINHRIKQARIDAGKTQQDLATHLDKTAASISDIERGKVQVSAAELFEIAKFYNKPIQYFFGVEFEKEIRNVVESAVQNSNESELDDLLTILNYTRKIKRFSKYASKKYDEKKEKVLDQEDMMEFYKLILPYFKLLDRYRSEALAMKEKLERAMGIFNSDN